MPTRGRLAVILLIGATAIAVLVGLGIGVYVPTARKTPEMVTRSRVQPIAASARLWRRQYGAVPPSDVSRLGGIPGAAGRLLPPNEINAGIETLYQCLHLSGFEGVPELGPEDRWNGDNDHLEAPIVEGGDAALYEFLDAWGNPLVYFAAPDYAAAEAAPPLYLAGVDGVRPRPWRALGGGFARPDSFQVFSMGPDEKPNTMDDVRAWED